MSLTLGAISRSGSLKSGCQTGTGTSRPSFGAAAHTRSSRIFSQRKAVLRSGTHSRRSRPSERCGSGAKRMRSTWPSTETRPLCIARATRPPPIEKRFQGRGSKLRGEITKAFSPRSPESSRHQQNAAGSRAVQTKRRRLFNPTNAVSADNGKVHHAAGKQSNISAQQQPTQYAPCSRPIRNAPDDPLRHRLIRNPRGDWHVRKQRA